MKFQHIVKIFSISFLIVLSTQAVIAQSGTVTINQDPKIEKLLDLKKTLEKENKLTDGYTIQLYYGELNRANSIIRKYRGSYGTWPASIEYETPNYKVWVGNFTTRLEADRALIEIQRTFPSAFILSERRKEP
jgi:hypothetical protein